MILFCENGLAHLCLVIRNSHRFCGSILCSKYESKRDEFKLCDRCRFRVYCGRECQTIHWKLAHKGACAEEKKAADSRLGMLLVPLFICHIINRITILLIMLYSKIDWL
jgi:hypothetical protein